MQYFETKPLATSNAPQEEDSSWVLWLGLVLIGALSGWFLGPLVFSLWAKVSAPGDQTAWYLTRSVAIVAYLVITGSVVWGLALSTKAVKSLVSAPLAMALHSVLSWLGVGLGGLHAVLLLLDHYYSYNLSTILIPFAGPYRPFWVGLGTISLY